MDDSFDPHFVWAKGGEVILQVEGDHPGPIEAGRKTEAKR